MKPFQKLQRLDQLFIIFLLLASFDYLSGIAQVPFHPDESSQIFMSSDLEAVFSRPSSLFWDPNQTQTSEQRLRILDAPLTRYLIGAARFISHEPPLRSDWDWSQDWQANQAAGAVPSPSLLLVSRWAVGLLFPVTLIFIYLSGKKLLNSWVGLGAAFFYALHPLVLLHARRAMAEGTAMFGIALFIWCILLKEKKPWLLGLAAAVAFNAKQSNIPLLLIGLLVILIDNHQAKKNLLHRILRPFVYLAVFTSLTLLLNPFSWQNPLQASRVAWDARLDLLHRQETEYRRLSPDLVIETPVRRLAISLYQLFINPPSFHEVGNYLQETKSAEMAYRSIPGTSLFRGNIWGGVSMAVCFLGIIFLTWALRHRDPSLRRDRQVFIWTALAQLSFYVLTVSLPFQRYVMPLLPFVCLLIAYGGYETILIGLSLVNTHLEKKSLGYQANPK